MWAMPTHGDYPWERDARARGWADAAASAKSREYDYDEQGDEACVPRRSWRARAGWRREARMVGRLLLYTAWVVACTVYALQWHP
jgi:hypothetical protein